MQIDATHSNAETVRLRVPLADSHSEKALGESLTALVAKTRDLEALIRNPKELAKETKYAWYLVTTFHTPQKKFIRERAFFARCAKHESLHEAMLAYVRNVNSRAHGIRGMDADLGHSDLRPAGSFAIVPLALRDPKYIDALIEHMRGTDMDHESFHASLIEELLERHGLCDATLRLLAFRAVDGAGQAGATNLQLAMDDHGLRERLASKLEDFAKLVDKISTREKGAKRFGYRELYVSNAGKALFPEDEKSFAAWLDFFRARGLKFGKTEAELSDPPDASEPPDFAADWLDDGMTEDD